MANYIKYKDLLIKASCKDLKVKISDFYNYLENKLGFDVIENDNVIDFLSEIIEDIEKIERSCEI